jgi:hypothetical protein
LLLVVIVAGLAGAFLLMTKFRPYIGDDSSFYAWWEKATFSGYKTEVRQTEEAASPREVITRSHQPYRVEEPFNAPRRAVYRSNAGVFVVHSWRPSKATGQVADVVIKLQEHHSLGEGDQHGLSGRLIDSVSYNLGPFFSAGPIVKTNAKEQFRLDVTAYNTFLCLATLHFKDGRPDVELHRYIDFPADAQSGRSRS